MSASKKLLDKLFSGKLIKYNEAKTILTGLDFKIINSRGTHQVWKNKNKDYKISLVYKDGELLRSQCIELAEKLKRFTG